MEVARKAMKLRDFKAAMVDLFADAIFETLHSEFSDKVNIMTLWHCPLGLFGFEGNIK